MPDIEWGEWLPDQQDRINPGATIAQNVYPAAKTYLCAHDFSPTTTALDDRGRGGITVRDKDNNVYIFVGIDEKLYSITGSVTDVSRTVGGAYTTGTTENWEFAKWNESVIATNLDDDLQSITLGAANYTALAGTPPKARHIGVVRNQIVLGNIDDSTDGLVPNRVHWSGFDDETEWTPGTNQSDFQDLKGDGGWVQRITGGEYGLVFQERAIWRMTYVGAPAVFQFDEIEPARGTPASGSVIRYGREVYYLGNDGFYVLRDGTVSQNISAEKISRFFFADADSSKYHKMSSAIDPTNNLVFWSYQRNDSPLDQPNRTVVYNWVTKRWSYVDVCVDMLFQSATFGYTLEELDAFGTLDTLPASLDSNVWKGGGILLGGISCNHEFGYFTGDPLDAVLETKEVGSDGNVYFDMFRSYTEGGSSQIELYSRNSLGVDPTSSGMITPNSNGRSYFRKSAKYHRIRETITDGFTHAPGGLIETKNGGRR